MFNYDSYLDLKNYFLENLNNLSEDIQELKDETWKDFIENVNV